MSSGMEKEEESEKHLQDILDAQSNQKVDEAKVLVIPTPEVFDSKASLQKRLQNPSTVHPCPAFFHGRGKARLRLR